MTHDPIRCFEESMVVAPLFWAVGIAIVIYLHGFKEALIYIPAIVGLGLFLSPFLFHLLIRIENLIREVDN